MPGRSPYGIAPKECLWPARPFETTKEGTRRKRSSTRKNPALRPFVEKRATFDAAMKKTEKHFKAMKDRLEPKPFNVVLPTQIGSSNPELVPLPVKPAGPLYFNTHRFKIPIEEPDVDQELMDALAVDLDMDVFNHLNVRAPEDLRRYAVEDMPEGRHVSMTRQVPHLVRTGTNVVRSHAMPPTPSTRSRLPVPLTGMQHDVRRRLRKPRAQRLILKRQMMIPAPTTDYWVVTDEDQELCRVHVVPRRCLYDPCSSSPLQQDQNATLPKALHKIG